MKKKGVGIAVYNLPCGLGGAGDPSQAAIKLNPDGSFALLIGPCDMGQGCNTSLKQLAAEELDVPLDQIMISNSTATFQQWSTGTFASRVSGIDAGAVVVACRKLKERAREIVSQQIEVDPAKLEFVEGRVCDPDNPEEGMSLADLAGLVHWGGMELVGSGAFTFGPQTLADPEDGTMKEAKAISWTTAVAEVEVDTETGQVQVLKMVHANDMGRVINPLLARGQINGSMAMGLGFALTENTDPFYPTRDMAPDTLSDYIIPTAVDMPLESEIGLVEIPNPNVPSGTMGFSGELGAVPAAVLNAIHDAIGVWVTDYPATPERILRALAAKEKTTQE